MKILFLSDHIDPPNCKMMSISWPHDSIPMEHIYIWCPFFTINSLYSTQKQASNYKNQYFSPHTLFHRIGHCASHDKQSSHASQHRSFAQPQEANGETLHPKGIKNERIKNTPPTNLRAPPISTNTPMAEALRKNVSFHALRWSKYVP